MREEENISKLVGLEPDFIGFIFYEKSNRFAGDDFSPSITSVIPGEIMKVGVFVNASPEYVEQKIARYDLDFIQLHGGESIEYCCRFFDKGIKIIKAFSVDEDFDFSETNGYNNCCEYFMFDTKTPLFGGSGKKFNWSVLRRYTGNKPFFLSGGIGPDDSNNILEFRHELLFALDLNSRFEQLPGLKNIELLQPFFNQIRS